MHCIVTSKGSNCMSISKKLSSAGLAVALSLTTLGMGCASNKAAQEPAAAETAPATEEPAATEEQPADEAATPAADEPTKDAQGAEGTEGTEAAASDTKTQEG